MALERIIQLHPAWDKRDPDPKKNYGIHGVNLLFGLKGEKGAVQFLLYTNWHLPHVVMEHRHDPWDNWMPLPADLGYHSPVPRYEGQESLTDSCEWLDGKPCYYDGSGLRAIDVYQRLLTDGDAGVWRALEAEYVSLFGEELA